MAINPGLDVSGNGNNWTTNNINWSGSGSTFDVMTDVPTLTNATTANYCVLNPLSVLASAGVFGLANLQFYSTSSAFYGAKGTIELPTTGKYYFESNVINSGVSNSSGGDFTLFGVVITTTNTNNFYDRNTFLMIGDNGWVYNFNTLTNAVGSPLQAGDVIGFAIDRDANTYTFYRNGSSINSGTINIASGTPLIPVLYSYSNGNGNSSVNFGQRPFAYTPPTGFVALNTFNLPTPTIGATASTQAGKYFNVVTYTGNGSTQTISGVGFQPDLVWDKARSFGTSPVNGHHTLYDAIRGATNELYADLTSGQATNANSVTAFTADGFSVGSEPRNNNNGSTYVAWNWNAGGSTVTNTSGSISAQVRANTSSGFSIATYTGNGSTGATVGHGLGVAPRMIIIKKRNTTGNWITYHTSTGLNQYLYLNSTAAAATATPTWGVSSTTFTLQQAFTDYNDSGATYVAYCFSEVAGYSKFGSYTGNGSTDGPFVYLGFRPRYLMIKAFSSGSAERWLVYDSARDTFNAISKDLVPNTSAGESGAGTMGDLLSNGFKITSVSSSAYNLNGYSYIYAAFAESPFKYANAR